MAISNRIDRNTIVWLDRAYFPPYIGFCPNAQAWAKFMKEANLSHPFPVSDANTTRFPKSENKLARTIILVTVNAEFDAKAKRDPMGVVCLLAHEVVHVWQMIEEDIGEEHAGDEIEAYAVQSLLGQVIWAYHKTRRRIM